MKKYFMFAVVVTAGMLASCSSESLTGSDPEIKTPDQTDLVPIEIGVATNQNKAMTRGTGTAGDLAGGDNIWNGERVNVLMYMINEEGKSTFDYVTDADEATPLYSEDNSLVTPLTVENKASGIAKEPTNAAEIGYHNPQYTYKVKYYPAEGRSDFWGYYLGGYGDGADASAKNADATLQSKTYTAATSEDPASISDATDDAATVKTIAFTIDGTHDLMVAKAPTGDGTNGYAIEADNPSAVGDGFTETQTNAVEAATAVEADQKTAYNSSYSAKAARKGLQPDLVFKHLLSRLTFKVQAGNENAAAVKVTVTSIKVHSKIQGNLIAAYKYDVLESEPERIIWDTPVLADPTDETSGTTDYKEYPSLTLKQRTDADDRTMMDLTPVQLTWGQETADVADVKSIGEALLVAPQDQYYVEINYKVLAAKEREWYEGETDYDPGAMVGLDEDDPNDWTEIPTLKATITPPNDAESFEQGKSYEINITLYGPEEIVITTSLTAWDNGGPVYIIGE